MFSSNQGETDSFGSSNVWVKGEIKNRTDEIISCFPCVFLLINNFLKPGQLLWEQAQRSGQNLRRGRNKTQTKIKVCNSWHDTLCKKSQTFWMIIRICYKFVINIFSWVESNKTWPKYKLFNLKAIMVWQNKHDWLKNCSSIIAQIAQVKSLPK